MSRSSGKRLQGCHVLSLRPVGGHDALRRAAAHEGGRVLALSPWKLQARNDDATRRQLRSALRVPRVVFTSPVAVRAAAALMPLHAQPGQQWCAVGNATARALQRAGIDSVHTPRQMDSEGLLALSALQAVTGIEVALVTAPGGRDRIATTLRRRGAHVLRVDVYARVPVVLSLSALRRLDAQSGHNWLALSSGQALQRVLDGMPADSRSALLRARVAAASPRLAQAARDAGFGQIVLARSALPRDLIAAMAEAG